MILIIDLGSQFTKIICRNIEYLGYIYQCLEINELQDDYDFNKIKALIISGGDNSIGNIDYSFLTKALELKIPILGICLGYQLISHYFGGKLENNSKADFGITNIFINKNKQSKLLKDINKDNFKVVMSHRDSVVEIPKNFDIICNDYQDNPVMIENSNDNIFAVQFHPEVSHSEYGDVILRNFVELAGCIPDDESESFLDKSIAEIKKTVGDNKVIAAVSGGVDSTVAAKLVANAIGGQLHCVFVDTGLMRFNEANMVMDSLYSFLSPDSVHIVYAGDIFLDALNGVEAPEEKRKIIGRLFIEILEREAKKINGVKFLLQGTILSDVIESGKSSGSSSTIKSHHNVGGLPKNMNLKLLEPLRSLFKDQVRKIGINIGIPFELINRHPFPGPGLAIRIIGKISKEKVEILQKIDNIFIEELNKNGIYDSIWQAFAVLLPIKSVGIIGDGRNYGYICSLRAITSNDGMTANFFPIDTEFMTMFWNVLSIVSRKIVNEINEISRVVYDITSKPPATIEWE